MPWMIDVIEKHLSDDERVQRAYGEIMPISVLTDLRNCLVSRYCSVFYVKLHVRWRLALAPDNGVYNTNCINVNRTVISVTFMKASNNIYYYYPITAMTRI